MRSSIVQITDLFLHFQGFVLACYRPKRNKPLVFLLRDWSILWPLCKLLQSSQMSYHKQSSSHQHFKQLLINRRYLRSRCEAWVIALAFGIQSPLDQLMNDLDPVRYHLNMILGANVWKLVCLYVFPCGSSNRLNIDSSRKYGCKVLRVWDGNREGKPAHLRKVPDLCFWLRLPPHL
jgi:hypothetical protein